MDEMTLKPITWPEGDEYSDPEVFKAGERMWWHQAIVTELRRQAELGRTAYNVPGIAGNLNMSEREVITYCRQMITWGELVKVEPLWDFEPDTWVALAVQRDAAA